MGFGDDAPADDPDAVGFGDDDPAGDDAASDAAGFGDDDPAAAGPGGGGAGADPDAIGFGDAPPAAPPPREPSPWSLTGFLRTDEALWLERLGDDPLAKARQSLDLSLRYKRGIVRLQLTGHAEVDLVYLADRDRWDGPTYDAYAWLVTTREALVAFSLGEVELTLGRQIVPFGEGDALSPLDVASPRDLREPGLADLDDLRLAVLATRVGWFRRAHRLELMVVHEADFGYRPEPRSPYSPFDAVVADEPLLVAALGDRGLAWRRRPRRFTLDGQQVLGRWVWRGPGLDLGVVAASVLDQQGVVDFEAAVAALGDPDRDPVPVTLDHRRYTVLGTSGAWPAGDLLLKWEAGVELGRPLNVGQAPLLAVEEATLVNTMVGLTWSGVSDLRLALEVWKPWLVDRPRDLFYEPDAPFFAARAMWDVLRQRLHLLAAASVVGWRAEQGWLVRAEATYDLRDGLSLGGGFITYQPGDDFGPFYGLDTHDRLYVQLRWDFQLL